ncbi:MAG: prolipoprotein diacylglyceryl transferase [Lachnospiraceae bacterium]|nr:prolipoprotein diacylglyceryl transferase [Lachnospiraceae bacterium]
MGVFATDVFDIWFVNLGIKIDNLVSYFSVFGFKIMFYGIIVGLGIVGGIWIAAHLADKEGLGNDIIYDLALFEVPLCILGARIYYVIFQWDFYKANPAEIINLRGGGLAIYGAVIMAFIVLAVFVKVRKVSPWRIADCAINGLILGQAIGRWGNFFNCEAFGGYTNGPFAMRINRALVNTSMITEQLENDMATYLPEYAADYIQVHPTFLYESVWNLCVFTFMLIYRKHKKFDGEMLSVYFIGYGIGRFFIEGLRTDQLKLWGTDIAVSQIVSIILIVVGVIFLFFGRAKLGKAEVSAVTSEAKEEATEKTKTEEE